MLAPSRWSLLGCRVAGLLSADGARGDGSPKSCLRVVAEHELVKAVAACSVVEFLVLRVVELVGDDFEDWGAVDREEEVTPTRLVSAGEAREAILANGFLALAHAGDLEPSGAGVFAADDVVPLGMNARFMVPVIVPGREAKLDARCGSA